MISKNKILFFNIFLYIFLLSCNYEKQENINSKFYFEAINFIKDKRLYDHFPKKNEIITYDVSIPSVGGRGLEIEIFTIKDKQFISDFKNKLKIKNLNKYSINNPCTNFFLSQIDTIPLKYKNCIQNNIPVPNYVFWLDPDRNTFNYSDIKDDLVYYVIEYKEGKYLPDSLLTNNIVNNQRNNNGFSRGYAISENAKLVVYWLIVW